ncbi:hypothetical protein Clacol_010243 [Clathrus columnatus]|uniref:Plastocyanin-like domain-containing protein n=1 Tax=Clathrus columnatus TaxID=1419009 RepID=A0AAV5AS39_9AGAM|nr:hypothetical protein Clacol_010243 [Clathrus columnatus]
MPYPFPPGTYAISNYENGDINAVGPGPIIPVVADPQAAAFLVLDYKPLANEVLGFEVHHLVNIANGGQPVNLKLAPVLGKDVAPSDKGVVAIFDSAVPNVWCVHPSKDYPGKYLIYFSRYGTTDHGPCHWHLESSKAGTNVTVDIDENHPINKVLRAHINAGRGASLADLTQKLDYLVHHYKDCFWSFIPVF